MRADIVSSSSEREIVRVLRRQFPHGVNLIHCALHGFGPVTVPEIQMEKKIASSPPSRMRGISIDAIGMAHTEIELRIEQALRSVVVGVHHDRTEMQIVRFLAKRRSGPSRSRAAKSLRRSIHRLATKPTPRHPEQSNMRILNRAPGTSSSPRAPALAHSPRPAIP